MRSKRKRMSSSIITTLTFEWLLNSVCRHVPSKTASTGSSIIAVLTLEWLLTSVSALVHLEVRSFLKCARTVRASVYALVVIVFPSTYEPATNSVT